MDNFDAKQYFDDQLMYGATNLENLARITQEKRLSIEELSELAFRYVNGINSAFRRCFPKEAFDNLQALNIVAIYILPDENMDIEDIWRHILGSIGLPLDTNITTEVAWKLFKNVKAREFPDDLYRLMVDELSGYVTELVRRANVHGDVEKLKRVLPAFKLLGYLHKMKEQTHYWCETEFDNMVRFGVDEENIKFRYLSREEAKRNGEVFFDQASSVFH